MILFEEMDMTAEEYIEMLKNMTDEEKNAMLESMAESMGEVIPEGYVVSWDGLTLNAKATLSADDLTEMQGYLNLNYLPANAVIKTNTDNTKYTINFSLDNPEANVEIIAVKNN